MHGRKREQYGQYGGPLLAPLQSGRQQSAPPQQFTGQSLSRRIGATSPLRDRRFPSGTRQRVTGPVAIGHPIGQAGRQRDKFVALPEEEDETVALLPAPLADAALPTPSPEDALSIAAALPPGIFEDLPRDDLTRSLLREDSCWRGRITFYCVADSFDRKKLEELLKLTYPPSTVRSFPDVFYVEYIKGADTQPGGDVFFFDYGVVACWGMTKAQEMTIVRGIATQCMKDPLEEQWTEVDEFQYCFSHEKQQHVQNDTVTLHRRYAQDYKMKLAISYALAQSTKLSVYEKRVTHVVLETKNLPHALAEHGEVDISGHDIAKLIGKVFLQKSAVNLLVLEMLDMLRDHQNNYHNVRLEWIVIWLIVVEVVVGLFELLGLFGLVGHQDKN
ncbi:hypothetical protein VOLCADRAFT_93224 [Volvox carteri f. nagariensis]|uniref:DUF155 domain-containing protein n=1 Tax=Volvox carteri f. nagariensis TaxID=3068 RepID=D8U1L8_VOLCA|nr:uncharacterized protein VOLCADRAFT_93224 [Volvox carteri f. nagariensis]EFJ46435.1 hypothetical protein VOLCADRAFT_93224 [Volvox carteri f. nagariensis]|eukprot:XP_002952588.1 hypothetical protein VOLCADRAFT_93224 [Volvox carteri f. nagariensis]